MIRSFVNAFRSRSQAVRPVTDSEHCVMCYDRPHVMYRVVDRIYNTVWTGGCGECAHMVAGADPELTVLPVSVAIHS